MNAPAQVSLADLASKPREQSVAVVNPGFGSLQSYELALRQAKLLSASTLVPAQYQQIVEKRGNFTENPNAIPNCVIAMNMAQRMGADPLMVMQNLYIVEGRPSWSSQWIIAAINGCGRFSPLRFDLKNLGSKEVEYTVTEWVNNKRENKKLKATVENLECVAWAIEKDTGEKITSPVVSVEMAVREGWYGKNGSKWKTMPEVMLRYRTASFFGKLYAPELLMGLQSVEEIHDVIEARPDGSGGYTVDLESLKPEATKPTPSPATEAQASPDQADGAPSAASAAPEEVAAEEKSMADKLRDRITNATDIDALDADADLIRDVTDPEQSAALHDLYRLRREELSQPGLNLE